MKNYRGVFMSLKVCMSLMFCMLTGLLYGVDGHKSVSVTIQQDDENHGSLILVSNLADFDLNQQASIRDFFADFDPSNSIDLDHSYEVALSDQDSSFAKLLKNLLSQEYQDWVKGGTAWRIRDELTYQGLQIKVDSIKSENKDLENILRCQKFILKG